MTRTTVLALRPVWAVAIALAAIALVFLASSQQAGAGGSNSLAIDPAVRNIGTGSSGSVELVSMAPEESLVVWVVQIDFDTDVITLAGSGCTAISPPAGAIGVSYCEGVDTGGGPDDDRVSTGGAIIFPSTERGLDGINTLATITFDAVGAVDECSDLTITVVDHLGPDTEASSTNPTITHGEVCITEGASQLWGDYDCNGDVDPIDALKVLRDDAGLPVAQAEDCPEPASNVTIDGDPGIWGDLDCGGSQTPTDALKTLRHDAGLPVTQEPGCPAPETEVTVS